MFLAELEDRVKKGVGDGEKRTNICFEEALNFVGDSRRYLVFILVVLKAFWLIYICLDSCI